MGPKWGEEERQFLFERVKKGEHPKDVLPLLNEKFGNNRTYAGAEKQLYRRGLTVPTKLNDPIEIEPDDKEFSLHLKHTRLQKEYKILSNRYKKVVERVADQEAMIDSIADRITVLPPAPVPKRLNKKAKSSPETVLSLFSDTHAGELVDSREIHDLNSFNFGELNLRTKLWAGKVIDIPLNTLSGLRFNKIVIGMLGDMVSGTIHEELLRGAPGNIVDWVVDYAYIVAQAIREIAEAYPSVEVSCVVGNHGRLYKKPSFKAKFANWDYMFYKHVSMHLRDQKNVSFNIPRSFWILQDIEGWRFLLLHGDNIRGWNGVPWYGINRAIAQLKEILESAHERFDYMCLGHFHSLATLDRAKGGTIINGSVKGIDEYSIGKMFTGNRAKQFICGVHPRWGKTWSYDIDLQDASDLISKGYIYPEVGNATED